MTTPWHRFWMTHADASQAQAERDAALWAPGAIAQTQREAWAHASQALQTWWHFWLGFWPRVPTLPPTGVLEPPQPPAPTPVVPHDAPLPAPRRRAVAQAATRKVSSRTSAAKPAKPAATRPSRTARGK